MGGIVMTINARQVLVTSKDTSEFQDNTFYKLTFVDMEDRKQYNASCKDYELFCEIEDMKFNTLEFELSRNNYGMKLTVTGLIK